MRPSSEVFRFGGASVQVTWHDAALRAALRPAIAHRSERFQAPALAIDVRPADDCWPERDGGLEVFEEGARLEVSDVVRGLRTGIDLAQRRAWFLVRDPVRLPLAERAAPFRLILQTWLRGRGLQVLHGGAVALPSGAVLFAAPGGGGKSNTFLSCLGRPDFELLGEDFIALDDEQTPRVWSLYNAVKLAPADVGRFPELAGVPRAGPDEREGKIMFDLGAATGAHFTDGVRLRAVLVLGFGAESGPTRLVAAAPGEAVRALLTSLLMILPAARRPLFEFTLRLARRVPAYRLELGRDPAQIAAVIGDFLTRWSA